MNREEMQNKLVAIQTKIKEKREEVSSSLPEILEHNKNIVKQIEQAKTFSNLALDWKHLFGIFTAGYKRNEVSREIQNILNTQFQITISDVKILQSETKQLILKHVPSVIENSTIKEKMFFNPKTPYSRRLESVFEKGGAKPLTKEEEKAVVDSYHRFFIAAISFFLETDYFSSFEIMTKETLQLFSILENEEIPKILRFDNLISYTLTTPQLDSIQHIIRDFVRLNKQVHDRIISYINNKYPLHDYRIVLKNLGYLLEEEDKLMFLSSEIDKFLKFEERIHSILEQENISSEDLKTLEKLQDRLFLIQEQVENFLSY